MIFVCNCVFVWLRCCLSVAALVLPSVELSENPLLECDDDSNVAVAGAVLHTMQVMSLMLT